LYGREALFRQSGVVEPWARLSFTSVEMMKVWRVGRERHSGRYAPLGNAGILRCAQNDDVKLTTATAAATATAKAKARAKTKYRDLSTAAAKYARLRSR